MSNKKILVIDDEEDIQDVALVALEVVGGWEVITADSGSEGLHLAATEQPDAILLDVMMPDLDGIATLERLKANPITQKIPVIFLTAKVQSGDRDRFARLDILDVIVKPFKTMSLSQQVSAILGWGD